MKWVPLLTQNLKNKKLENQGLWIGKINLKNQALEIGKKQFGH
jgi:hypothetical protein